MHLLKTLLLLNPLTISVLASPEAEAEAANNDINAAAVVERHPLAEMDINIARGLGIDLTKRACNYNKGCECISGHEGVWCAQCRDGNKFVVKTLSYDDDNYDHVYQCDKKGTKGSGCCDYGYATKCKNGAAGRCGN